MCLILEYTIYGKLFWGKKISGIRKHVVDFIFDVVYWLFFTYNECVLETKLEHTALQKISHTKKNTHDISDPDFQQINFVIKLVKWKISEKMLYSNICHE